LQQNGRRVHRHGMDVWNTGLASNYDSAGYCNAARLGVLGSLLRMLPRTATSIIIHLLVYSSLKRERMSLIRTRHNFDQIFMLLN